MLDEKNLAFLEQELNYTFQDNFVIEEALTHSSYAHENGLPYNNERLEYLGDSILSFIVARTLYRIYPEANEGELTKMRSELVKADSLYRKAEKLGIPSLILHGNAIRSDALPKKMIADAMEAVIGAVCVDGGVDVAERIIKDLFLSNADERTAELDPKSVTEVRIAIGYGTVTFADFRSKIANHRHRTSREVQVSQRCRSYRSNTLTRGLEKARGIFWQQI